MTSSPPPTGPDPDDVAELRRLLDMMVNFANNDQRARYLLTCDWMRDRGAAAAARVAEIAAAAHQAEGVGELDGTTP